MSPRVGMGHVMNAKCRSAKRRIEYVAVADGESPLSMSERDSIIRLVAKIIAAAHIASIRDQRVEGGQPSPPLKGGTPME